jgi:hypothetical protein
MSPQHREEQIPFKALTTHPEAEMTHPKAQAVRASKKVCTALHALAQQASDNDTGCCDLPG